MKNRILSKYIPGFMSAVLLTSTFALSLPQGASAKTAEEKELTTTADTIEDTEIAELLSQDSDFYKFLEGLENLPAGIEKQGPEKIAKWLTKKTGVEVIADGENLLVPSLADFGSTIGFSEKNTDITLSNNAPITTFGAVDCVIAVGLMIGTVGFPASKLLKLKKAIDLLGGITKTVDRIYASYKKYKSWNYRTTDAWKYAVKDAGKGLPGDVLNAFLDFFNITNVINQCT